LALAQDVQIRQEVPARLETMPSTLHAPLTLSQPIDLTAPDRMARTLIAYAKDLVAQGKMEDALSVYRETQSLTKEGSELRRELELLSRAIQGAHVAEQSDVSRAQQSANEATVAATTPSLVNERKVKSIATEREKGRTALWLAISAGGSL